MREIKFRAWNKKRKRMYEVLHLHLDSFQGVWATVKGRAVINDQDIHIQIQPKDIEVMQWTGMHDKRETLIFEGDIVDFSVFDHNGSDTQYRGVVKFSSGQWVLWNSVDSEYYGSDGGFMLYWVHQQDDGIEVIGNVYQNPELINS